MPEQDLTFVIVGASLAGAKAAEALRAEGFDGRVVLIGDEAARPYERPPLSKDYLRGDKSFDDAAVHPAGFYDENGIDLLTSTTVDSVDTSGRRVLIRGGESIPYDSLLLCTGAEPRRLRSPGSDLAGVHYLRTVEESDALRDAVKNAGSVAVIGAGWIGAEVAASVRQLGADVTVIEMAAVPLERVLGAEVGAVFRDLHLAHGVKFRFGVGVESLRGAERVEEVVLADGTTVAADVVVVGVGVVPRVGLAEEAGLAVDNGVLVDEHLAASVAGVYAAGDVANAFHPRYRTRIRLEHWSSALNQGPAAARSMLGLDSTYERTPYFFSDQYDLGMEYRGWASAWDEVVFRGDASSGEFISFWMSGGRVVAAMNANVWDAGDALEGLVRNQVSIDAAVLADPGTDLNALAGSGR